MLTLRHAQPAPAAPKPMGTQPLATTAKPFTTTTLKWGALVDSPTPADWKEGKDYDREAPINVNSLVGIRRTDGTIKFGQVVKKAGFFYLKLRGRSTNELDRLRAFRRAQVGWVQRFVIVAMFLLICAPVVAKYLCRADLSLRSEICN